MSLRSSWTSATYLSKIKSKALNTLFNSAEYHKKGKSIFFVYMPKNLARTQQQADSM
jgi:hypothetical protein